MNASQLTVACKRHGTDVGHPRRRRTMAFVLNVLDLLVERWLQRALQRCRASPLQGFGIFLGCGMLLFLTKGVCKVHRNSRDKHCSYDEKAKGKLPRQKKFSLHQ
eukprot:1159156-Pelagomonas_calceolata.AAC.22